MPEIWLQYGKTDIALDIRFENLYKEIRPTFTPLQIDQFSGKLQDVPLSENSLVIVLSSSTATKQVLSFLVDMATGGGVKNITIVTLPKLKGFIDIPNDKNYSSSLLSASDLASLNATMAKFEKTVFLSHSAYDPFFGFEGTPTHVLRNFMQDKMSEAFSLRTNDLPNPGIISEPYRLALSVCKNIEAMAIEIVGNSNSIAEIYCGPIEESFTKSSSKLIENSGVEENRVKSAIISPGSDLLYHATLTQSLNCLWNSVHIISDHGTAILLGESSGGLGSIALEMFVEGRTDVSLLREKGKYVEGQEHIMFLEALKEKYDLGIISTLPEYYLKTKLGLKTFDSLKQVLTNLLSRYGKNHKVSVISDAHYTSPRTGVSIDRQ
jgi:hypothetical protein